MRVLLPVLLSILLCIEPAHSLKCYNCTKVQQSSQCTSVQCPGSATHCGSLEAGEKNGPENQKFHFKGCTNSCENFFTESFSKAHMLIPQAIIEVGYSCCSKELCNGADGIRSSPFALLGALLLSLGPAFFWAMM
ncbi:lymphocyte antigen 6H [Sarcophilus harrisii]|uniref:lymphocyte antigen 6H n=1 Tax=Sarcophilus harrisii TaxID=9305 RepID=UPI00062B6882|nr:lymphocyte antigen 6H [Sarcophilus harrisii]XP_031803160.1 lymphocyte antigen 6H [Sarcophilus harrisii]